jgi:hypothetical protein
MLNTKDDDLAVLRYKTAWSDQTYSAHEDGQTFIREVYERIKNGKITFPGIKDFDKSRIALSADSDYIVYHSNDYDKSRDRILCYFTVESVEIGKYFGKDTITYYDSNLDVIHVFCRHGLFWYFICNAGNECEIPLIVKKFWWFTSFDKMMDYMFNKFENQAL